MTHLDRRPADNPEVVEARSGGIPVLARAEALAAIAARRRCIAVAGTHGKTTTASMLALILVEAGLHPSFLIGGDVNEIGTNAVWDAGEWMVVEADESDGTFLHLVPEIAVVTNVEADHLDHYGILRRRAHRLRRVPGRRPRRPGGRGRRRRGPAIGRAAGADLVGRRPTRTYRHRLAWPPAGARSPSTCWDRDGALVAHLAVAVPGLHNARNAAVATVAALAAGAPADAAARALARFGGVARRFEFRGRARTASPSSTTTPTCPPRSGPRWRRPATATGVGWWPCSSPTATRGRPRSGRSSRTPSPTPTSWW